MKPHAPPLMPFDYEKSYRVRVPLNLAQRGAYYRLIEHYWTHGSLFFADHDLADTVGIGLRTFKRMRPALAQLFEIDTAGLWRDPDLEARRSAALKPVEGRSRGAKKVSASI